MKATTLWRLHRDCAVSLTLIWSLPCVLLPSSIIACSKSFSDCFWAPVGTMGPCFPDLSYDLWWCASSLAFLVPSVVPFRFDTINWAASNARGTQLCGSIQLSFLNWTFTSRVLWDLGSSQQVPTIGCINECTFTKEEPLRVPLCLQNMALFPGLEAVLLLPRAVLVSGWMKSKFYSFGSVLQNMRLPHSWSKFLIQIEEQEKKALRCRRRCLYVLASNGGQLDISQESSYGKWLGTELPLLPKPLAEGLGKAQHFIRMWKN